MRGVNKVILVGNVGNDPEVTEMESGSLVANVSLATSESWKNRNDENVEHTEWHRVVFYSRLAEIVEEYVHKGDSLYVEGKLKTRSWEQDGVKRYTTEIVAREMQMLGSRRNSEAGTNDERTSQRRSKSTSGDGGRRSANPPRSRKRKPETDEFNDDIPF